MGDNFSYLHDECVRSIKNCYTRDGFFVAGTRLFYDLWTRDFCFASPGISKAIGEDAVKRNLEVLLRYQHENGKIAQQVSRKPSSALSGILTLPFFDVRKKNFFPLTPAFKTIFGTEDLDSTMLFLIYYAKFTDKTHSEIKDYDKLLKAAKWVESQDFDGDGLVEEDAFAGWEDSINKTSKPLSALEHFLARCSVPPGERGKSAYENVLACEAYRSVARLAEIKGDLDSSVYYSALSKNVWNELYKTFWNNKGYLSDFVGEGGGVLNASANLLAIYFGLLSKRDSLKVLKNIEEMSMNEPFGLKTRNKRLPAWRINLFNHIIGTSSYQDTTHWLWLGALYVIALKKLGFRDKADVALSKIEELVKNSGGVREVYTSEGKPLKSWFFSAEDNFLWSSGMLLEALNE